MRKGSHSEELASRGRITFRRQHVELEYSPHANVRWHSQWGRSARRKFALSEERICPCLVHHGSCILNRFAISSERGRSSRKKDSRRFTEKAQIYPPESHGFQRSRYELQAQGDVHSHVVRRRPCPFSSEVHTNVVRRRACPSSSEVLAGNERRRAYPSSSGEFLDNVRRKGEVPILPPPKNTATLLMYTPRM